jgi:hypothetical protein
LIFYKYHEIFDVEDEPIMIKEENEEETMRNKYNMTENIYAKFLKC